MKEPIKFPKKPNARRISRWDKNSRYAVFAEGRKVYTNKSRAHASAFMDGWNACSKEIAWLNKERYE